MFADVYLPRPLSRPYTYHVPSELEERAACGCRVWVPFGRGASSKAIGFISRLYDEADSSAFKIKSIEGFIDRSPVILPKQFELARWMARFYGSSLGEIFHLMAPHEDVYKNYKDAKKGPPANPHLASPKNLATFLNEEQHAAVDRVWGLKKPLLLHGLTGTGKTEVYLAACLKAMEDGKQVLVLVPEIALTTQIYSRFIAQYGSSVIPFHSKLSDRERAESWLKVYNHEQKEGKGQIIVGPRSALYAPFSCLGLIIMDEEHDRSYKNENTPRYHARQICFYLRKIWSVPFICGSATPSIEVSYYAGVHNKKMNNDENIIHFHNLTIRHGTKQEISSEIIDLSKETSEKLISNSVKKRIASRLDAGEQILVFFNRRGHSTQYICQMCKQAAQCTSCDVFLTYHQDSNLLLCHYCGFSRPVSSSCSNCGGILYSLKGYGTEHVEEHLSKLFPKARIARLDRDTATKKDVFPKTIGMMERNEIDILLGTQMIAKGLHFPGVTLSVVLLADLSFIQPDFRAGERTYQLINQVAGRAGRGKKPGTVIVQTWKPQFPAIRYALSDNYEAFLNEELRFRKRYNYPPYCRLSWFTIRSKDETEARTCASMFKEALFKDEKVMLLHKDGHIIMLGPSSPSPSFIKNYYRRHILVKWKKSEHMAYLLERAQLLFSSLKKKHQCYLEVDIDPA